MQLLRELGNFSLLTYVTILASKRFSVLTVKRRVDKVIDIARVGRLKSDMQAKQKVTLYLSPELHRQLKIRAAIDSEPMSDLAERAIVFYLAHPEVVDEVKASHGRNHQIYACPECATSVVIRNGEIVPLGTQPGVMAQEKLPVEQVHDTTTDSEGEEALVPC